MSKPLVFTAVSACTPKPDDTIPEGAQVFDLTPSSYEYVTVNGEKMTLKEFAARYSWLSPLPGASE